MYPKFTVSFGTQEKVDGVWVEVECVCDDHDSLESACADYCGSLPWDEYARLAALCDMQGHGCFSRLVIDYGDARDTFAYAFANSDTEATAAVA